MDLARAALNYPWRARRGAWVILVGVALLVQPGAIPAQSVKEEVRLHDKPSGTPQGAALPAGAAVKMMERQGFWVRVEAGSRSGWLKATSLVFSNSAAVAIPIDTGRLGAGNIVSVSAARGLSADDLMNGTPRPEEVARLVQLAPEPAAVQAFLAQGRITPPAQVAALQPPTEPPPRPAAAPARVTPAAPAQPAPAAPRKTSDDW